jgi:hypothetical protein
MRGMRTKRVRTVKEDTLSVTVDIGMTSNTGYCTTVLICILDEPVRRQEDRWEPSLNNIQYNEQINLGSVLTIRQGL